MKGSNEAVSTGQDRVYFLKITGSIITRGPQIPITAAWIRGTARLFPAQGNNSKRDGKEGEARTSGRTRNLVALRKPGRGNKHHDRVE